jgi:hypothetical protein
MAVRISILRADRSLLPWRFLVFISIRGWVEHSEEVWLEGLDELKNPMSSSRLAPATLQPLNSSWTRHPWCMVIVSFTIQWRRVNCGCYLKWNYGRRFSWCSWSRDLPSGWWIPRLSDFMSWVITLSENRLSWEFNFSIRRGVDPYLTVSSRRFWPLLSVAVAAETILFHLNRDSLVSVATAYGTEGLWFDSRQV